MILRSLVIVSLLKLALYAVEDVTLQLKWFHSFQFAGYYMAQEKGFYKQNGLNVKILEATPNENHVKRVVSGEAQYGVNNSTILLQRAEGLPVKVLAAIFQHDPLVFITKKSSGIVSPLEMKGKKISFNRGLDDAPLQHMLSSMGIDSKDYNFVPLDYSGETFINSEVDVISGYQSDQPFFYQKKGIEINVISPLNYGIDYYGDMLYTTEEELENHPQRAKNFLEASLKGWEYALENVEETIELIQSKYGVQTEYDHLAYEAKITKQLIASNIIKLGYVNKDRFYNIALSYASFMKKDLNTLQKAAEEIVYTPEKESWKDYFAIAVGILFASTYLIFFILFLNKKLKTKIEEQVKDIRTQKERFEKMFKNHDAMMFQINAQTREIIDVNQSVVDFYGYSFEEFKGMSLEDINVDGTKAISSILGTIIEKNSNSFISHHKLKNGEIRTMQIESTLIQKEPFPISFSIVHDITDLEEKTSLLKNEKRNYQNLLETATDGIHILNAKGEVILCNQAFADSLQYSLEEAQALKIEDWDVLFPKDQIPEILSQILKEKTKTIETYHKRKDGSVRFMSVRINPVKLNDETLLYCSSRDMTETFQIKREIEALQQVETVGFFYLKNFTFVWTNETINTIFGYKKGEMNGLTPLAVHLSEEEYDATRRNLVEQIHNNGSVNVELTLYTKDRCAKDVQLAMNPVKIPFESDESHFIGVMIDISERKAIEKEKEDLRKELESSNTYLEIRVQKARDELEQQQVAILEQNRLAQMGELLHMIAHQWRQPLNDINIVVQMAFKEIYERAPELSDLEEYENSLTSSVEFLSHTINDFQNFFKTEKKIQTLSLHELLSETQYILNSQLKQLHIALQFNVDSSLTLQTYKGELLQVLLVLFNNAIDAFKENNIQEKTITLNCTEKENNIILELCDTAGGISEDIQKKIFDPYFSTKKQKNGTGLGLYISKMIVERSLCGTISNFNTNNGTCFRLELPKDLMNGYE